MTLDGPMNAVAFLAYVEQVLAPTLNRKRGVEALENFCTQS